ncbi:MAG: type II secretion system F family protein [Lachnospiraceae bacterium]|nr:type II secretion system F family protein [Lachnospiraceae bacterium]
MIRILFEWTALCALTAYVFYRSLPAFAVLLPGIFPYAKYRRSWEEQNRRSLLSMQFRESILAVSTALNAGYSVENAFIEAYRDMKEMYGDDAPITLEFYRIVLRLRDNEQIEYIIRDLGRRSEIEDINDFAAVFEAAKRIGGDMTKIIKKASANISEKIDVKREIETSMSARRLELRVMEVVPFGILLYLQTGSSDFISILYRDIAGRMLMTAALAVYLAGVYMAEKIINIEV